MIIEISRNSDAYLSELAVSKLFMSIFCEGHQIWYRSAHLEHFNEK